MRGHTRRDVRYRLTVLAVLAGLVLAGLVNHGSGATVLADGTPTPTPTPSGGGGNGTNGGGGNLNNG
jgi:hypothetical protein